jgi:hypothetical protein
MKLQMKVAKLAAILVLKSLFFSTASLAGQTKPVTPSQPDLKAALPAPAQQPSVRLIVVSLQDRRLALLEDGQVKKVYPVAVGKDSTPSPTGTFTIVNRVTDPTYYHEGKVIPPGPANPVGNRWIGLSQHGYGIHGTNAPHSIGKAASHGCIRMSRRDLEELFAQIRPGDTVEILGDRNQETAALFGTPAAPAAAPAPTQTVAAQAEPGPTTPPAPDTTPTPVAR